MGSIDDISQLCRLCLVKDQVNIPIFDGTSDIGQTFIKIESCLPVKVSRNDNLPKKICDGCSYKLDMLYTFRNTSIDSEKQLIQWLNQAGLSTISQTTTVKDPLASTTKPEIMVKQENFDTTDSRVDGDNPDLVDPQSFMIQQDHLGYEQEFVDFGEASGSNANDDSLTDEPAPKRAKRAAALKKAPLDDETEDDLDAAMQITKAEEEDEEEVDQPEYVEAPSTSADDQPGPSGVGKATTEAPVIKLENGMFGCDICFKEFPTKFKILKHKRTTHKEKRFSCLQCGKLFGYHYELLKHVRAAHEDHRPFPCTVCSKTFKSKLGLDCHVMTHTNEYQFRCDICNIGCTTKGNLTRHIKIKHEGFRYQCNECNKEFTEFRHLRQHQEKHKPGYVHETFTCERCGKVFQTKRAFNKHVSRHTGEFQSYICDICGKSLASAASLRDHIMMHAGEKNFACEFCGKAFVKKQLLVEHIRVHTKERPFKCEFCKKGFTQRSVLKIHMRHHTGERPYTCHICSKGFVSKASLNSHKCKL